ncbi:unnamed protein product [Cylicostephanus goldi]|uniref:Uncharacterized protein n=1 Tax=Cylicostephanus goldi TaxID=71465 RepID=A0A3P7MI93_CYLGO|nr:unnamed protein product [Cylicostephanus goldi]
MEFVAYHMGVPLIPSYVPRVIYAQRQIWRSRHS